MNVFCRLLLLALLPAAAQAACLYRYPVYEQVPQLYSETRNGSPGGLLPMLAERLQQLSGCQLQPQLLPLARRNALLQQGRLQIVLLAVQHPPLERSAVFVPLFSVPLRATVPLNSPLRSADELLGSGRYRIGLLNGAPFPTQVEQRLAPLLSKGLLEYSNDRASLYLKLQHGRLHAVLETTSWLYSEQGASEQALRFISFNPPLYIKAGAYLSHQLPPDERDRLQRALQQMVAGNEIAPLVLRFIPQLRQDLRRP